MQKITEIKHFLSGETREYSCTLINIEEKMGILKYVLERPYNISGLILPIGTITYGFYWTERAYTLYRWYYQNKNIGNYFNIADRVELGESEFCWRDLILDVLIKPAVAPKILDEDELPGNISENLRASIYHSLNDVMTNFKDIITETDELLFRYL